MAKKSSRKRPSRSATSARQGERYLVVDGRRWRRSDPSIPEAFRSELVSELMSARRAVLAATRAGDAGAEATARARVHAAKVSLGERGPAYWESPNESARRVRAAATIRALLSHRGPDKTICPSDVARVIGGDQWRSAMKLVREIVGELADEGALTVKQHGKSVDAKKAKGPIRLAQPAK